MLHPDHPQGPQLETRFQVLLYCPDRHIVYDGKTPEETGVGGGITARVRMAHALQRAGHQVTMAVNCKRTRHHYGVRYVPFHQLQKYKGDVLIMNTSGGNYDLAPILAVDLDVKLRIIWVSGTDAPAGTDQIQYDYVYAKSNFLKDIVIDHWGVPPTRVFVVYNGFEEVYFQEAAKRSPARDPFRLVYFSHPSKGLDLAIPVLRRLRMDEPRFHLVVFGGTRLWGQDERPLPFEKGLAYFGLIGQRRLARELLRCTYALSLQSREEPFGMTVTEAMRAGCVVLASPVGSYPELIRHKYNGLLIRSDRDRKVTVERAARSVLSLDKDPETRASLSRNAAAVLWDSDRIAQVWADHWAWALDYESARSHHADDRSTCQNCGGLLLWLADGAHCTACGSYQASQT